MHAYTKHEIAVLHITGFFAYYRDSPDWINASTVIIRMRYDAGKSYIVVQFKNEYYPIDLIDIPEDGRFIPLIMGAYETT